MTTLTIEEIAERRLELIQRLQTQVEDLTTQHYITMDSWMRAERRLENENKQLRRIINEAASLLKAPSNDEEPKEEEQ